MSNYCLDFTGQEDFRPLAARMRPTRFEQYIGQRHILAEGKPLRRALESGHLHSMILWGPQVQERRLWLKFRPIMLMPK